jgi:hypothetical protein
MNQLNMGLPSHGTAFIHIVQNPNIVLPCTYHSLLVSSPSLTISICIADMSPIQSDCDRVHGFRSYAPDSNTVSPMYLLSLYFFLKQLRVDLGYRLMIRLLTSLNKYTHCPWPQTLSTTPKAHKSFFKHSYRPSYLPKSRLSAAGGKWPGARWYGKLSRTIQSLDLTEREWARCLYFRNIGIAYKCQ